MAVRALERHQFIGVTPDRPAELVHGPVMTTTQRDEIRLIRLAPGDPRDHVVHLGEVGEAATGKSTPLVPSGDLSPLGDRRAPAHALLIEDAAVTPFQREHHLGVARQAASHLTGDGPDSL